ncbi:MAG: diacylglycerol kinase family protein [Ktedonobacterales bacterium]
MSRGQAQAHIVRESKLSQARFLKTFEPSATPTSSTVPFGASAKTPAEAAKKRQARRQMDGRKRRERGGDVAGEHTQARRSSVARAVDAGTAGVPATGESEGAGIERASFLMSFVYAWKGILYAVRTQRNMRVHIAIFVLAVTLGVVLRISPVEFAMVFVAATGVFIAEMVNTVAEAVVDLVTREYHPLARIAKDVAAGVVLMNALLSVVIGLFVFVPHLWPLVMHALGR